MLVIIYTQSILVDYLFDGIQKDSQIRLIPAQRRSLTLCEKIIRKLLYYLNISNKLAFLYYKRSFLQELKSINDTDIVQVHGHASCNELIVLTDYITPKAQKYLWYWNPLKKDYKKHTTKQIEKTLKKVQSLGFKIETFDKSDALNYRIDFRNQFYRYSNQIIESKEYKYDFYFLGYPKDREEEIITIENQLKKLGFRVCFLIVKNKQEEITYVENIKNILVSKCIVDINQKGQSGITLRPLEALFLGRKLLTNNKEILYSDFYNSNNIFVWGESELNLLPDFVTKEMENVSNEVYNKYEINNWLNYYIPNFKI